MLEPLPKDQFTSDSEQAHRSARAKVEFALTHVQHLHKVDPRRRAENAARSFLSLLKAGEILTPGQLSYCDGIYEQTMKAMGLPSVGVHSDRRRKSLKYG